MNNNLYILKVFVYTGIIPAIFLPLILKLIDYLGKRFLEK
tara:strand:- start:11 stop:130 length:120 start_codon:yes stop_codon:yes gene_type:complete